MKKILKKASKKNLKMIYIQKKINKMIKISIIIQIIKIRHTIKTIILSHKLQTNLFKVTMKKFKKSLQIQNKILNNNNNSNLINNIIKILISMQMI